MVGQIEKDQSNGKTEVRILKNQPTKSLKNNLRDNQNIFKNILKKFQEFIFEMAKGAKKHGSVKLKKFFVVDKR